MVRPRKVLTCAVTSVSSSALTVMLCIFPTFKIYHLVSTIPIAMSIESKPLFLSIILIYPCHVKTYLQGQGSQWRRNYSVFHNITLFVTCLVSEHYTSGTHLYHRQCSNEWYLFLLMLWSPAMCPVTTRSLCTLCRNDFILEVIAWRSINRL